MLPVLVAQFKSKADLKKTLTTLLVGQLRFTGVTLGDEKKSDIANHIGKSSML